MPRLRRYLPPLLLLLPLIFICGKLLLTPVEGESNGPASNWQQGWPWVFREFRTLDKSASPVQPAPLASPMALSPSLLLADVALLAAVIGSFGLLLLWQQKRSGTLRQFSLRGMLLLVAIAAVACGWWASHAQLKRREQQFKNAWCSSPYGSRTEYCGPEWAKRLVPARFQDVFHHVVDLEYSFPPEGHQPELQLPAKLVEELPRLSQLRNFTVSVEFPGRSRNQPSRPLRLAHRELRALSQIRGLHLVWFTADDETLRQVAQLRQLESLDLVNMPISDDGLAALANCDRLEFLSLSRCDRLTDNCVDSLAKVPALKTLILSECNHLTEAGIEQLAVRLHLDELLLLDMPPLSERTFRKLKQHVHEVLADGFESEYPSWR
jgi:hypothetical protein